jgi:hypothetical protein
MYPKIRQVKPQPSSLTFHIEGDTRDSLFIWDPCQFNSSDTITISALSQKDNIV